MSLLREYMQDEQFRQVMAQEDLIMEVTEALCELLEREKVSRKELAERLGKSKGFVSQVLNGGRNLTLRTIAEIVEVLGYRIALVPEKKPKFQERCCNILEFSQRRWDPDLMKAMPNFGKGISPLKVAA